MKYLICEIELGYKRKFPLKMLIISSDFIVSHLHEHVYQPSECHTTSGNMSAAFLSRFTEICLLCLGSCNARKRLSNSTILLISNLVFQINFQAVFR